MTTANISYDYNLTFENLSQTSIAREERASRNSAKRAAIIRQDKKATICAILIIGFILISTVIVSAYTANLKYENNELIAANEELQNDIDMLNVKIQTAVNLENIEKVAKTKLGMTYPDSSQYIYISNEDVPTADFAVNLKDKVYN